MTMKDRPILFLIVGASASGKTTVARFAAKALGIPLLCSYTTRPMREGEQDGVDHYFVTDAQMPPRDEMLAYTLFGGYHYWVPISDVRNPRTQASHVAHDTFLYVIDEDGVRSLVAKYADDFILVPINVIRPNVTNETEAEMQQRLERDKARKALSPACYWRRVFNEGTLESFEYAFTSYLWEDLVNRYAIEDWYRYAVCDMINDSEDQVIKNYEQISNLIFKQIKPKRNDRL